MFFLQCFVLLNKLHFRRKYDVVHVHSLPDYLVFVALFQKMRGVKIVLDLHEAMPEILAARFKKSMDSKFVSFTKFLEKKSHRFADHLITVNEFIKELLSRRTVPGEKITVIMNSPDEKMLVKKDLSDFEKELNLDGKFITVFVGGINPERNLEVIIEAVALAKVRIPEIYLIIMGHLYGEEGENYKDELKELALKSGLDNNFYIGGRVEGEDVASYLDLSHFGIVSYLHNPLTDVAVPNKVFEYIALGKPVIACRLKALQEILGEDAALYYEPENAKDLCAKILWLYENKDRAKDMLTNADKVYEKCKWDVMKMRLQRLYRSFYIP
jgi:glycosyltransferase involved in cell wall biosynthesis